jgi:predicted transcriptional regulator
VARRRIQPKPAVELETVTLRLPAQLVRSVDQYAKYLGGSTDRTYVIGQAIEIAMA